MLKKQDLKKCFEKYFYMLTPHNKPNKRNIITKFMQKKPWRKKMPRIPWRYLCSCL